MIINLLFSLDEEASKYHDHNLLENNTFLESFAFQIAKGMVYIVFLHIYFHYPK